MLCMKFPFKGFNDREMFDKILSGTYVMSSHHKSPAIAQIIKLLLTNDPATRITVDVLVEEFSKIPIEI